MTDKGQGPEKILAELKTPSPPLALREEILRSARAALTRPGIGDRWANLYSNRLLRAVWATGVIVLVVANVVLSLTDRRSPQEWFRQEASWRLPELQQVVRVPRLREAYVSLDAFMYRPPTVPTPAPDGHNPKERVR